MAIAASLRQSRALTVRSATSRPSTRLPYRAGSLHRYILSSPESEALPGSEIWGYGGIRFSIPDVLEMQKKVLLVLQFNFLMQQQQR